LISHLASGAEMPIDGQQQQIYNIGMMVRAHGVSGSGFERGYFAVH
jgi:hypothetical protein